MRRSESAGGRGIAVVGVGNWGASLLAALKTAGAPAREIVRASGRTSGRTSARGIVALEEARLEAEVLWLCVPDTAIAAVAERAVARIAELRRARGWQGPARRGQIIVHSSGALSSGVLAVAGKIGVQTASVHPMMSFPSRRPVSLHGVPFAVETEDAGARRRLLALVRRLGGWPFALPAEGKTLYHAAGALASPLLASLLAAALECMRHAGMERAEALRVLAPLARRTVENVFRDGPERSFSGPIARGDAATVALHLQALERHPSLARVYRSLAAEALETLPSTNAESLRALLSEE